MSPRWTRQKYIQEQGAQQKLWHEIRNDMAAHGDQPESCESKLYFYRKCIERDIILDDAQKEEFRLLAMQEPEFIDCDSSPEEINNPAA